MNNILEFITREIMVVLMAALPIIELRGSIPFGVTMGLSPHHAFLLSLAGSMIPVPFLLFTIRPFFDYLRGKKSFRNVVNKLTSRTLNKSEKIRKYGFLGLMLFVAIPLPGTGVWSGTLAAALLDIRFKTAFLAILLGNIIAGLLITMGSYSALQTIQLFK